MYRLARHCDGRVRFWQCDNEPNNVGLTWLGTAQDYVAQLKVMHRAVNDADPAAAAVLGGATYGLPASAPDSPERQFYDVLLRDGRDAFDVFDLYLYGPAEQILTDIDAARSMMRALGYEKPLLVGDYNAPWPNLYPEATAAMEQAIAAVQVGNDSGRTPEDAALATLYAHGRPAAATADVHARLPAGAGRQAGPAARSSCATCWPRRREFAAQSAGISRKWWCGSSVTPSTVRTSRRPRFAWPWPAYAEVIDAFGQTEPVEVHDGRVRLQVSLTPLFVMAD